MVRTALAIKQDFNKGHALKVAYKLPNVNRGSTRATRALPWLASASRGRIAPVLLKWKTDNGRAEEVAANAMVIGIADVKVTGRAHGQTGGCAEVERCAGSGGLLGDNGPAITAHLNNPQGVAVDSAGNLYIADQGDNRVRRISGGVITTLAGNGTQGGQKPPNTIVWRSTNNGTGSAFWGIAPVSPRHVNWTVTPVSVEVANRQQPAFEQVAPNNPARYRDRILAEGQS